MTATDLPLQYIAANKEPVTEDTIEALILRAFAHQFCNVNENETTGTIIAQLSGCMCTCRLGAAYDDGEEAEAQIEAKILTGPAAEKFYCDEIKKLYTERGFDSLYAEESASWPDFLPMDETYLDDTLRKMAELEVGHDLIVIDYMRATAAHRQAVETKIGSAQ